MKWIVRTAIVVLWGLSLVLMFGAGALVGNYAPHLAEWPMRKAVNIINLFTGGYQPCGGQEALKCGYRDTTDREEVNCIDYSGDRTAVLMTFGQSNSANAGRDRYLPTRDVANFNIHDGRCYRAEDPLLGPDAQGGSVWGVLGDKLVTRGDYDRVLVIPFGIGGSAISQWQEGAYLHPILTTAAQAVTQAGITPTHVLWHQGESDAGRGTSTEDYTVMFKALLDKLREYGIDAPVYPAIATFCEISHFEPDPAYAAGRQSVRAAQVALARLDGVRPGPDTDTIQGLAYRHDNCHFSAKGMQVHAELWYQALTAPLP